MNFGKNGTLVAIKKAWSATLNFKTYFNILLSEALKCV